MPPNELGDRLDDVLETVLGNAGGTVYVTDPSAAIVEAIVDALEAIDDEPTVRLLADEETIRAVFDDFLVASSAADLAAADVLSVRTPPASASNPTLVTDDGVTTLVDAGTKVAGLRADDPELVDAARTQVETAWDDGEAYSLRTPPMSEIRERLEDDLEPGVEEDFQGMLDSLETARGDSDDLDEVTVSLLAAARNDALLYDISRWGEDTGVASKATFSRTKTRLEDAGLVETEKVPIEVGRPRLRLTLADERLKEAEPGQVVTAAQSVLN